MVSQREGSLDSVKNRGGDGLRPVRLFRVGAFSRQNSGRAGSHSFHARRKTLEIRRVVPIRID